MRKLLFGAAAFALFVSACGGSTDNAEAVSDTTAASVATSTTAPPTTTAAPTTTTEAPSLTPSGDPDIDAVVNAFTVAFDSTSDYDEKLPYVDDLSGLEETIANYMSTGETMGGVSILVTEVVVDGADAAVSYDLLFNGNPIYPDLTGTAMLTDQGWQVPRAEFCSMMSNARVGCPAE